MSLAFRFPTFKVLNQQRCLRGELLVHDSFGFGGVYCDGCAVFGDAVRCFVGARRNVCIDVVAKCRIVISGIKSRGSVRVLSQ
jgi:hypothetical protein